MKTYLSAIGKSPPPPSALPSARLQIPVSSPPPSLKNPVRAHPPGLFDVTNSSSLRSGLNCNGGSINRANSNKKEEVGDDPHMGGNRRESREQRWRSQYDCAPDAQNLPPTEEGSVPSERNCAPLLLPPLTDDDPLLDPNVSFGTFVSVRSAQTSSPSIPVRGSAAGSPSEESTVSKTIAFRQKQYAFAVSREESGLKRMLPTISHDDRGTEALDAMAVTSNRSNFESSQTYNAAPVPTRIPLTRQNSTPSMGMRERMAKFEPFTRRYKYDDGRAEESLYESDTELDDEDSLSVRGKNKRHHRRLSSATSLELLAKRLGEDASSPEMRAQKILQHQNNKELLRNHHRRTKTPLANLGIQSSPLTWGSPFFKPPGADQKQPQQQQQQQQPQQQQQQPQQPQQQQQEQQHQHSLAAAAADPVPADVLPVHDEGGALSPNNCERMRSKSAPPCKRVPNELAVVAQKVGHSRPQGSCREVSSNVRRLRESFGGEGRRSRTPTTNVPTEGDGTGKSSSASNQIEGNQPFSSSYSLSCNDEISHPRESSNGSEMPAQHGHSVDCPSDTKVAKLIPPTISSPLPRRWNRDLTSGTTLSACTDHSLRILDPQETVLVRQASGCTEVMSNVSSVVSGPSSQLPLSPPPPPPQSPQLLPPHDMAMPTNPDELLPSFVPGRKYFRTIPSSLTPAHQTSSLTSSSSSVRMEESFVPSKAHSEEVDSLRLGSDRPLSVRQMTRRFGADRSEIERPDTKLAHPTSSLPRNVGGMRSKSDLEGSGVPIAAAAGGNSCGSVTHTQTSGITCGTSEKYGHGSSYEGSEGDLSITSGVSKFSLRNNLISVSSASQRLPENVAGSHLNMSIELRRSHTLEKEMTSTPSHTLEREMSPTPSYIMKRTEHFLSQGKKFEDPRNIQMTGRSASQISSENHAVSHLMKPIEFQRSHTLEKEMTSTPSYVVKRTEHFLSQEKKFEDPRNNQMAGSSAAHRPLENGAVSNLNTPIEFRRSNTLEKEMTSTQSYGRRKKEHVFSQEKKVDGRGAATSSAEHLKKLDMTAQQLQQPFKLSKTRTLPKSFLSSNPNRAMVSVPSLQHGCPVPDPLMDRTAFPPPLRSNPGVEYRSGGSSYHQSIAQAIPSGLRTKVGSSASAFDSNGVGSVEAVRIFSSRVQSAEGSSEELCEKVTTPWGPVSRSVLAKNKAKRNISGRRNDESYSASTLRSMDGSSVPSSNRSIAQESLLSAGSSLTNGDRTSSIHGSVVGTRVSSHISQASGQQCILPAQMQMQSQPQISFMAVPHPFRRVKSNISNYETASEGTHTRSTKSNGTQRSAGRQDVLETAECINVSRPANRPGPDTIQLESQQNSQLNENSRKVSTEDLVIHQTPQPLTHVRFLPSEITTFGPRMTKKKEIKIPSPDQSLFSFWQQQQEGQHPLIPNAQGETSKIDVAFLTPIKITRKASFNRANRKEDKILKTHINDATSYIDGECMRAPDVSSLECSAPPPLPLSPTPRTSNLNQHQASSIEKKKVHGRNRNSVSSAPSPSEFHVVRPSSIENATSKHCMNSLDKDKTPNFSSGPRALHSFSPECTFTDSNERVYHPCTHYPNETSSNLSKCVGNDLSPSILNENATRFKGANPGIVRTTEKIQPVNTAILGTPPMSSDQTMKELSGSIDKGLLGKLARRRQSIEVEQPSDDQQDKEWKRPPKTPSTNSTESKFPTLNKSDIVIQALFPEEKKSPTTVHRTSQWNTSNVSKNRTNQSIQNPYTGSTKGNNDNGLKCSENQFNASEGKFKLHVSTDLPAKEHTINGFLRSSPTASEITAPTQNLFFARSGGRKNCEENSRTATILVSHQDVSEDYGNMPESNYGSQAANGGWHDTQSDPTTRDPKQECFGSFQEKAEMDAERKSNADHPPRGPLFPTHADDLNNVAKYAKVCAQLERVSETGSPGKNNIQKHINNQREGHQYYDDDDDDDDNNSHHSEISGLTNPTYAECYNSQRETEEIINCNDTQMQKVRTRDTSNSPQLVVPILESSFKVQNDRVSGNFEIKVSKGAPKINVEEFLKSESLLNIPASPAPPPPEAALFDTPRSDIVVTSRSNKVDTSRSNKDNVKIGETGASFFSKSDICSNEFEDIRSSAWDAFNDENGGFDSFVNTTNLKDNRKEQLFEQEFSVASSFNIAKEIEICNNDKLDGNEYADQRMENEYPDDENYEPPDLASSMPLSYMKPSIPDRRTANSSPITRSKPHSPYLGHSDVGQKPSTKGSIDQSFSSTVSSRSQRRTRDRLALARSRRHQEKKMTPGNLEYTERHSEQARVRNIERTESPKARPMHETIKVSSIRTKMGKEDARIDSGSEKRPAVDLKTKRSRISALSSRMGRKSTHGQPAKFNESVNEENISKYEENSVALEEKLTTSADRNASLVVPSKEKVRSRAAALSSRRRATVPATSNVEITRESTEVVALNIGTDCADSRQQGNNNLKKSGGENFRNNGGKNIRSQLCSPRHRSRREHRIRKIEKNNVPEKTRKEERPPGTPKIQRGSQNFDICLQLD